MDGSKTYISEITQIPLNSSYNEDPIENRRAVSLRQINRIEKKNGRNRTTLLGRAAIYFNKKEYKKSLYYFQKSMEMEYSNEALAAVLKIKKKLKDLESVLPFLEKIEKDQSTNSLFLEFFAFTLYELEKFEEAAEKLVIASQYGDQSEMIRQLHIKSLRRAEKFEELLEVSTNYIANGFLEETIVEGLIKACVTLHKNELAYEFLETTTFDWQKYGRITAYASIIYYSLNGDIEKSTELGEKAIQLEPDNVQIRWNLALSQLRKGDFKQGSENYKIRWDWEDFPSPRRTFTKPKWNEYVPKDSKIMIWTEQGIGDELLFASALNEFQKLYPNLIYECHGKTLDLFEHSFPLIKSRFARMNEDQSALIEDFDYQIPIGDVFLWFLQNNLEKIESGGSALTKGYLKTDPLRRDYWSRRLRSPNKKPKIGFSWTSSVVDENRKQEHTNLTIWKDLLMRQDAEFVCLQYNFDHEELRKSFDIPESLFFDTGYLDQWNDLEGSAALISNLDLVITSGASPYILAGGLGIETWVYSKRSPFVFGRTKPFCDHPVLSNIKFYHSEHPLEDKNLAPNFQKKLDQFVQNFRENTQ